MGIKSKMGTDEFERLVNQAIYKGIIGSLLYLTTSKLEIFFSVGMCARFQACPRESHLKVAKQILRHLKKIGDLILLYLAGDLIRLVGYENVGFAGYQAYKKRTSGMTHFLGSLLISLGTKKQNSVALLIAEVKYVDDMSCFSQLIWIKKQLEDFRVHIDTIPLMYENTSVVNMEKNLVQYKRTKHINIRYYLLRDNV